MASPTQAASLAASASRITTVGAARAVLGEITAVLHQAYGKLDEIGRGFGNAVLGGSSPHHETSQGTLDDANAETRDAARARLDGVNNFAARIYDAIGTADPDLQAEEISAWNSSRVALCMVQTQDALDDVEAAIGSTLWDFPQTMQDITAGIGETAGNAVQATGNAIAAGATAFVAGAWKTLAVAGVVATLYVFRAPILRAIGKAAA